MCDPGDSNALRVSHITLIDRIYMQNLLTIVIMFIRFICLSVHRELENLVFAR